MSDIQKTKYICEMYKKEKDSTSIEDMKIPSLVNNLKSKTLMKLIGYYREKKIPIDIIVLFYDLEKRPFSLFKFVFKLMKLSKDIESKIKVLENTNPITGIKHEFKFEGKTKEAEVKTKVKVELVNNQRKTSILQELKQYIQIDEDQLSLVIVIQSVNQELAQVFQQELKEWIEEVLEKVKQVMQDEKVDSFIELLGIQVETVGEQVVCRVDIDYPALQPCVSRFSRYITSILGQDNQIVLEGQLDSVYSLKDIINPIKFLLQCCYRPQTDIRIGLEYGCIPSLVGHWLQHLRDVAKTNLGSKWKTDNGLKSMYKQHSLWQFLLSNQGVHFRVKYQPTPSEESNCLQYVKKFKPLFQKYFTSVHKAYIFAKQRNLDSFVEGLDVLSNIIGLFYQYSLLDFNVYLNAPPFILKVKANSEGLKEQAEKFITF